ncbi:MAG: peptidylprolyl isomerase, partial [Thermoanaerobaculia bacterium]|nr:peptidylprolyl isomerase [Thermoanaerobaculia bacterium]
RLAQKMEFLSEDMALQDEPTPEELASFYAQNPDPFVEPPRLAFTHVYFSRDRRGADAEGDAAAVRERLPPDPRAGDEEGDRFMLQLRFGPKSEAEIGQLFGRAFASAVFALEPGAWQGPIESGYGVHLVFVESRTEARQPPLDEVATAVRNELLSRRRSDANRELYESLRSRYVVEVQVPEVAALLGEDGIEVAEGAE